MYVHIHRGFHKFINWGTPKWMVYNGNPNKVVIWGYRYFRKPPYFQIPYKSMAWWSGFLGREGSSVGFELS